MIRGGNCKIRHYKRFRLLESRSVEDEGNIFKICGPSKHSFFIWNYNFHELNWLIQTVFLFIKKSMLSVQKENINHDLGGKKRALTHLGLFFFIIAQEKHHQWCHSSCWLPDRQLPQSNMRPFGVHVKKIGRWMTPMRAGLYSLWEHCPNW